MSRAEFDLVIRNGEVVDGTGGSVYKADVAIRDGLIVAIGSQSGTGIEEIDASGKFVTPGFVDIHTHYDGQITWEQTLSPSSDHGVTTVVTGNCGVGFAPCRQQDHELLVKLMEGVEDIPEVVMTHGIPWNWVSFPEFLDALQIRECDSDFATQIPHSAVRIYIMGERGAELEAPTQADLDAMTGLVREAVLAGALGVSTSRSIHHRSKDGRLAPSVETEESELMALARGLKEAGRGVFQLIPNPMADPYDEFALIRRIAEFCGRPVSFSLMELPNMPNGWQIYLELLTEARSAGLEIRAQVYPRPIGFLFGLDLSYHPFCFLPSYQAIRGLPIHEQLQRFRDPLFRTQLITETSIDDGSLGFLAAQRFESMYVLSDPPVYDPPAVEKIGTLASKAGISAREYFLDRLIESDGNALLYSPVSNYVNGSLTNVYKMINDPGTVFGLGDGGAHYGMICDASYPTFTLARWVRDASGEERLSLPAAIAAMTSQPAAAVGLTDRGVLKPGYRAHINVIDLEAIKLRPPKPVHDLPEGGRRMIQRSEGYDATIVNGRVTYRRGISTGAFPGKLIRGGTA